MEVIVVATGFSAEYCDKVIEKQIMNPTIEISKPPVHDNGIIRPLNSTTIQSINLPSTPLLIERPIRSYEDIEKSKSKPAYLTQGIILTQMPTGKKQVANKGAEEEDEATTPTTTQISMF